MSPDNSCANKTARACPSISPPIRPLGPSHFVLDPSSWSKYLCMYQKNMIAAFFVHELHINDFSLVRRAIRVVRAFRLLCEKVNRLVLYVFMHEVDNNGNVMPAGGVSSSFAAFPVCTFWTHALIVDGGDPLTQLLQRDFDVAGFHWVSGRHACMSTKK